VLLRDGLILLAKHEREGHGYWVLPGGEVEPSESPEEAAVREVREEAGLEIRIERLLFVDGPRFEPGVIVRRPRHTFLGAIVGGELRSKADLVGRAEKGCLAGVAWMRLEDDRYDSGTRDTLELVTKALFVSVHNPPAAGGGGESTA
jgi:ADP-ribose pyrophosphatase YjhB (NUDIX family)